MVLWYSHRQLPGPHVLAGQGKHRWASWQLLFWPVRFCYRTENETKTTIRTKTIIARNEHQSELQSLLQFDSKIPAIEKNMRDKVCEDYPKNAENALKQVPASLIAGLWGFHLEGRQHVLQPFQRSTPESIKIGASFQFIYCYDRQLFHQCNRQHKNQR